MLGTAIKGENGDRKVIRQGRNWRVRVKLKDELPSSAPVNGNPVVAPSAMGISVSVASLAADGSVAKDTLGRLLVFDPHTLTFMGDALANPAFDPAAIVEQHVLNCIDRAAAQLPNRDKVNTFLDAWGG